MNLDMLGEFAGQPVWLWIAFLSFVALVLWVDLALVNNKDGRISAKKSALMWGSFAACAMVW
jgi:tellurite resistance protein TerC